MVILRSSGWLRSEASSQEMSVVIWNRCSRIGSVPPTIVAVTIPLPIARALCRPIIPQSLAIGKNQLIGPIKPNVSANNQIASPTPTPARMSLLRRRTWNVKETAVKQLIRLLTRENENGKAGSEHGKDQNLRIRRILEIAQ